MAGFFLFRGLHPQCVPRRFEGKDALLAELAQLGTFRQQCNMLKAMSFERQELSASCQFFYSLWNLPFCQATWILPPTKTGGTACGGMKSKFSSRPSLTSAREEPNIVPHPQGKKAFCQAHSGLNNEVFD